MTDTEPTAEAPELTTLKDLLVDLSEDQASAEPSMSATQLIDSIDQHFEAVRKAEGMMDHDYEYILEMVRSCNDPSLPQAVAHLLDRYDRMPFIREDHQAPFPQTLIRVLAENPHGREALEQICAYMASHEGEYMYKLGESKTDEYAINEFMDDIHMGKEESVRPLVDVLLSSADVEMQHKVLRMLVDSVGFAHVVNGVRRYIEGAQGRTQAARAEATGKWLLGLADSDVPFHQSLNAFYASMGFERFPLNLESQERDVEALRQELERIQGVGGSIVDLGCGTGRLANALAAEGQQAIVGIDTSPVNLAKAQIADASGIVTYREADWTNTGLPDNSAKLVFSLGRTLPHAEDAGIVQRVFSEARRVLADGGVFYFDVPDPETGLYFEARKRYLENLRAIGMFIVGSDEEVLPEISMVVDSPDGINFTNRFMPALDLIKLNLHFQDFEVEEVGRYKLRPDDEAECVYFRATKKPKTPIEELVARLSSREPSSSLQSVGDE
jgi:SAM-dependent methyltransferase